MIRERGLRTGHPVREVMRPGFDLALRRRLGVDVEVSPERAGRFVAAAHRRLRNPLTSGRGLFSFEYRGRATLCPGDV